jgi:flagellar motor protein MotB
MTDNKLVFLRRAQTMAVLLMGMAGLAACSSVPDAVNPVEWYHGVEGWFESEENQQTRTQAKTAEESAPPLPGAGRDYPNLSTVPERPRSVSSPEERKRVSQGLAADRENARYAEPEPDRPSGAALGAPTAPRVPVTRQPAPTSRGPSPEGLEPLPIEPQPTAPAPGPRSSAEPPAPAATAAVAKAQPASVQPAVAQQAAPAAPPPAPVQQAQAAAGAPPAPQSASLVEQTYNEALAQYDRAAAQGATAGGSKTVAGTPIPRSFLIHFSGGSAQIGTADRALLRDVAQLYKSTGGNLRIVGHASSGTRRTDALSQRITNFRTSSQRAEAVASELARLGVPRANMTVSAVSDSEPIYDESQPRGEAGNRRVEIFFGP